MICHLDTLKVHVAPYSSSCHSPYKFTGIVDLTGLEDKSTRSLNKNSGSRNSGNALLMLSPKVPATGDLHESQVVKDLDQVVVTLPEDESKASNDGQSDQVMQDDGSGSWCFTSLLRDETI